MATNTAASFTNHTGNGSAGPFSISFSYLSEAEVDVTVGGVAKTLSTHYTFTSATQITFTSGNEPGSGVAIKFQRDTNIGSKKVDFVDGSVLTEADLDNNSNQLLFSMQEILDNAGTGIASITATTPLGSTSGANPTLSISAATTSAAGSMSASDKTKLDGIETSATADQTASEIKTLVENASDSNVFTDADHSKLNAIEASATADQTGAEIKTSYEAEANTNAYTDAEKTKLAGIETNATGDQTAAEVRTLVESASDSNVFTDADHTKLNSVESNATADQTGAEIKSAYEGESNTNAFTDAEKTKLSGVEASADVTDTTNVDAAGAVMNSDNSTAAMGFVVDEDNMASNSATKVPTQQSVKSYVDANSSDTTYTAGNGLQLSGTEFSVSAVALTTVQEAANESAQLALTTQEGDVVVRTDQNKSYVKNSGTAGTMADFTLLRTPTDAVLSVNGNTGAITAAQIATAVEAASDSNTFTDADHSKLNAIEASATADQTDSEIKTAYENNSNTNAFTDAEQSKLSGIASGAEVNVKADFNETNTNSDAFIQNKPTIPTNNNQLTNGAGFTTNQGTVTGVSGTSPITSSGGTTPAIGISAATTSAAGSMSSADKTKLDGVETNATADQTAAEIRTLVESASDSNVFTDADHTKLNGIESSATADQTGAEIKSLYEGESNTNAFTDAEQTKLSNIETSADVTDATNVNAAGAVMNSDLDGKGELLVGDGSGDPSALAVGTNGYVLKANSTTATGLEWAAVTSGDSNQNAFSNVAVSGQSTVSADGSTDTLNIAAGSNVTVTTNSGSDTVTISSTDTNTTYSVGDGGLTQNNFTDAQKTKLDGIESSATADQTGAEIKTAYEAESNTNAFTDAEKTKLSGVASSANNYSISSDLLDEDNMASNSATKAASQQSIKAYVDANTGTTNLSATANGNSLSVESSTGNNVSLPAATTSAWGVMTDDDKTKLDAIESSATADQTASEIRTLVESASDSNVFTDADHSKLNAIETSADVTDATNVNAAGAVMNSDLDGKGELLVGDGSGDPSTLAAGTNGYVLKANSSTATGLEWTAAGAGGDTNQNAFSNIAVSGQSTVAADSTTDTFTLVAGTNVTLTTDASNDAITITSTDTNTTYNVGDGGLTQNNFTNTLKTKLDGIEASATADQTGAEIKSAYEGESDTNAFTDAEKTKLSGIAASANVGLTDIVGDTTPQLGGNLDVQSSEITTSTTNGNIKLNPNGTGVVEVKGDGSSADGTLQLNCSQNSHGVKIKSPPHSAGASYTLTLPNTDGAANQVLKSDGSGNLDWVNQTTDTIVGGATGVDFNDNVKSRYGSNDDLEIYCDSTYNIIDNAHADLHIKHGSEFQAKFNQDGAVEIYYNGNVRLATSNAGLTATGTLTATTFSGSGASLTSLPAANLTGTLPAIDGSNLTGISAGATGGGSDEIFYENGQNVTTSYTITNGKNAMAAGPITIDSGAVVTVGVNETLTIV